MPLPSRTSLPPESGSDINLSGLAAILPLAAVIWSCFATNGGTPSRGAKLQNSQYRHCFDLAEMRYVSTDYSRKVLRFEWSVEGHGPFRSEKMTLLPQQNVLLIKPQLTKIVAVTIYLATTVIVVVTIQIVVTIAVVTTTIWFTDATLKNRLAEATKSFSPVVSTPRLFVRRGRGRSHEWDAQCEVLKAASSARPIER